MPAIADQRYVRITTFTKDGERKHTPVWIADLGDGTVGFTTGIDSWKVKRIRHTPRVELTPSDARGRVAEGATTVTGTARVVSGDEFAAVAAAIKAKYGFQVTMIHVAGKIAKLFRRTMGVANCGIVITLDEA